jgi:NitT/TauT family transport system substrate-binding protein
MKKIVFILQILVLLFLSGCSGKNDAGLTIRIAEQFGLAYAPLQIMKAKGFLEELSPEAKVQWLKLGNTAAIREAVLAGDLDAGFMGIPPFLIARDKGMKWKIATGLSRTPLGLVVPEGKYTSLKDFKENSRIALPQPGSIQHILLTMAVNREMGDPAFLDKNLISLKHPDGMNALLSGAVDGHFTSPPYLFYEDDEPGFEVLLSGEEAMGSPFTFIVGVVTEDFYKTSPQLYEDLIRAIEKSIAFIYSDREETVGILSDAYSMDYDLLMNFLYRPGMIFETEIKGLDTFIRFMYSKEYLSSEFTPGSVQF